jgi:hypothetical protein
MNNNFAKRFAFNNAARLILHYENEIEGRDKAIEKIKGYFLSIKDNGENLGEFYRFMKSQKDKNYGKVIDGTIKKLDNLETIPQEERKEFAMFLVEYGYSLPIKDNSDKFGVSA